MRILNCSVSNFASYKDLILTFNYSGLCLIHGNTGSGKSTLCDLIPWIIWGKTAKGGSADEVLSWSGGIASGSIEIELNNGIRLTIGRLRNKSKNNDLYFSTDLNLCRGKDLQDTQKIINQMLGISYELYLSGAYFHEFSQTAQFFITTPKNRRAICEQLVDLSLPLKLQDKIKEESKLLTKQQDFIVSDIKMAESNIQMFIKLQDQESIKFNNWSKNKGLRLAQIESNALKFEANRTIRVKQAMENAQLKAKSKICSECGTVKTTPLLLPINNSAEIQRIENEENPYIEQLATLELEVNPYDSGVKDFAEDITKKEVQLKYHKKILNDTKIQIVDLDVLSESVQQFRGLLIKNTILDIEAKTNILLSNHFDAEIKIELVVEDTDKVDILITKDGNSASYTQLSKGQRQLLKLCFGLSVMDAVSNHHGTNFSQVFIDEALDGLDQNNKIKAVKMLESLALNKAIYLVEHSSEVKTLISNKIEVELIDGHSVIHAEA